jgi:hypothetical protein
MTEANGTYWGGSYFLDCNFLVLKNSSEILRVTSAASGNVPGTFVAGDNVYVQAYDFFTTYPQPSTGTSTITLIVTNTTDSTTVFSDTIAYTGGGAEPQVISTSFNVTRAKNYSISAYTTYTPVSATPTPSRTPTVTPSVTPSKTPTATPSVTPTRTPSTSGYLYQIQSATIYQCDGFGSCTPGAAVTVSSASELTVNNYYFDSGAALVFRITSTRFGSNDPADYSISPSDVTGSENTYCCI